MKAMRISSTSLVDEKTFTRARKGINGQQSAERSRPRSRSLPCPSLKPEDVVSRSVVEIRMLHHHIA